MKKTRRIITANANTQEPSELSTEEKYSNADLLVLLMTILELQGQTISAVEKEDVSCDFTIGRMTYSVATNS